MPSGPPLNCPDENDDPKETHPMIVVYATFATLLNRRDTSNWLTPRLATIKDLPGCVIYEAFALPSDERTVVMVEAWASQAEFDAALRTNSTRSWSPSARPTEAGRLHGARLGRRGGTQADRARPALLAVIFQR